MEEDTLYVQEYALHNELKRRRDPANKINTQGIEIFDTKKDTKDHGILELGLKRQVLYYKSLYIANVNQIRRGAC